MPEIEGKRFELLKRRTIIEGLLRVRTGLHVGAGGELRPGRSDNPVMTTADGLPFIPGSSLKGVIRSFCERLLQIFAHPKINACLITSGEGECLSVSRDEEMRKGLEERVEKCRRGDISERELTAYIEDNSCFVCKLFGSPYLASKIYVEDCFVADGFPARIEVRDGVAIERDTLTVAGRLKYDYEVAAPATTFKFRILVENASDEEMGLLFLALRQLEKGALRLGGNTSRGLGVVGLTYSSIQDASFSDPETLLQYLVARESGVPEPSASEEPAPRPGMVEDIEGFVEERIERLISKLREGGRPRYRLKALRTWIKSLISKLR